MIDFLRKRLKFVAGGVVIVALAVAWYRFYRYFKEKDERIAELSLKLAQSQETVEIQKGLYATKVVELASVESLLDGSRREVAALKRQLSETGTKLLSTQELVIKWKKAYEALLASSQTEEPGPDGAVRKRVDFSGRLGPLKATGHTLTDPSEAFLKIEQVDPLILTVSVGQNKDGTWSSFVTSSDENIDVRINLAGVNPRILSPKWYQRFWVTADTSFLGERSAGLGLSYVGDRWSLGGGCRISESGSGCGVSVGARIFR